MRKYEEKSPPRHGGDYETFVHYWRWDSRMPDDWGREEVERRREFALEVTRADGHDPDALFTTSELVSQVSRDRVRHSTNSVMDEVFGRVVGGELCYVDVGEKGEPGSTRFFFDCND